MFSHETQVKNIDEAKQLSRTRFFWILNYLSDYDFFDFFWEPAPWESQYIHAWPSQWQKDGGTYLVPKCEHEGIRYQSTIIPRVVVENNWEIPPNLDLKDFDYTWHPDPTEPPLNYQFGTQHQKTGGPRYVVKTATNTKFVQNISANVKNSYATKIWFIDHYDENIKKSIETVNSNEIEIEKTRYSSNYLDTLRRIAKRSQGKHDFIWVCSSLCDYTDFDFSWHPEQWQSNMIHVFPSNEQKFGDTFFVPVNELLQQEDIELLEWHQINFITDISVPRWQMPVVRHEYDNQVDAVLNTDMNSPLALYTNTQEQISNVPTISLWREKTKTVTPLSSGASQVIIPRGASPVVNEQIYDYPYIDKSFNNLTTDTPLDIVFISNGESNAEENWNRLLESTKYINNRVTRVDGNNGRVAAYQAALSESNTDWAFCVFAKLEVSLDFDWAWQPDRLQERKHYIFNAKNPVNGLEYGHMAMIAYNKKLVLENDGSGLDFTLSQKHTTVPLLSGVARFNSDPWMTWRTAFRECLKLRNDANNIESEYRLEKWLTVADGENGEWCTAGAKDAIDFYDRVSGEYEKLKLSYEWQWLREYYDSRYS